MSVRIEGIEVEDLRRMHSEGMTQVEIADWYGVGQITISRRMREFGIETRYHAVNEDFFKVWTKESAWVFGWFVGDGSIATGKSLTFYLARKDKEVLYKFKDVMESEHPIHDYPSLPTISALEIGSRKIVEDLRNLYVDNVPEKFERDLIRGFFEAEGSVMLRVDKNRNQNNEYIRVVFTQKDSTILKWIWEVLKDEGVVEGGSLNQIRGGGVWQLVFGEANSVSLYHYLYDDCGVLYFHRKKSSFEELMARRGYL